MKDKTQAKFDDATKIAAFKISKALQALDQLPKELRERAVQTAMARVEHIRNGDQGVMSGEGFIFEKVDEPKPAVAEPEAP